MTNESERAAFVREDRYIVIKKSHLSATQLDAIEGVLDGLKVDTVDCVVVEEDWPEHETVWAMIEARMTGKARAQLIAEQEKAEADLFVKCSRCHGSGQQTNGTTGNGPDDTTWQEDCEICGCAGYVPASRAYLDQLSASGWFELHPVPSTDRVAAQGGGDSMVIKLLLAAGHVSQSVVDNVAEIARNLRATPADGDGHG